MMKKLRTIVLICVVLFLLTACDTQNPPSESKEVSAATSESVTEESVTEANSGVYNSASFEGNGKTEDTPWGIKAGIIDYEDTDYVFLMPDTSVSFPAKEIGNGVLSCRIHPWVAESSDGAGLLVWFLDADNNIIRQEQLFVSATEAWQEFSFDADAVEAASSVKILCNNGTNNNNDGDWVIFSVISKNDMTEHQADETWKEHRVVFRNVTETNDNPWNTNAGIIESEQFGSSLLLTPNTGVEIYVTPQEQLSFHATIHPWVADASDGAGLVLRAVSADDTVLFEDSADVMPADQVEYTFKAEQYPGIERFIILCGNGPADNDNGDWVVIY